MAEPEAAITVFELLMMGGMSPKHDEQLRNTGIINSTTRLHLVGSFYEIYITMHRSMNIKSIIPVYKIFFMIKYKSVDKMQVM